MTRVESDASVRLKRASPQSQSEVDRKDYLKDVNQRLFSAARSGSVYLKPKAGGRGQ
jgi:hypothetical protein